MDGVAAAVVEQGADTALTVAPFHGFVWRAEEDFGTEDASVSAPLSASGEPRGHRGARAPEGGPGPLGDEAPAVAAEGSAVAAVGREAVHAPSGPGSPAAGPGGPTGPRTVGAALPAQLSPRRTVRAGGTAGREGVQAGHDGGTAGRAPATLPPAHDAPTVARSRPGGGRGVNHDKSHRPRRQDRPQDLLETGAAYAMRADGFRAARHRFFGRTELVRTDAARVLEVDDPHDLARARALAPLFDGPATGAVPTRADVDAVVMDFDGTQTDDRVLIDADGREFVAVHRGDGLGVAALRRAGLVLLILSTETNPVVAARGRKLQVPVLHGVDRKDLALKRWCEEHGLAPDRVLYVGNDVNDLPCFDLVGWPVAVASAHDVVRGAARSVTTAPGGDGALREIASWLLGPSL
ncbi:HAD hydrolase family protein [Streptomyces eurocidicus]|uniref:HAD hydrolase family protein n=1 Tax=Streptomyces eurocidicus TaxID=66423 RepID=UPI00397EA8FF